MKELLIPVVQIIGGLLVLALVIALIAYVWDIVSTAHWHKRIKIGTPIRLDIDNPDLDGGWYVVKGRTGDTVELIRLAPDNRKKNITTIPTDVTCDVCNCKKF